MFISKIGRLDFLINLQFVFCNEKPLVISCWGWSITSRHLSQLICLTMSTTAGFHWKDKLSYCHSYNTIHTDTTVPKTITLTIQLSVSFFLVSLEGLARKARQINRIKHWLQELKTGTHFYLNVFALLSTAAGIQKTPLIVMFKEHRWTCVISTSHTAILSIIW